MTDGVTFTIFTATYDRASTLPRTYEGLRSQSFEDFEWIIGDDGSSDGTDELVAGWIREASFPIRYFQQGRQGPHVAYNRAVSMAKGRFILTCDSDDWLLPDGLRTLLDAWESIPRGARDDYVGVAGLCVDQHDQLLGDPFPQDPFDSDALSVRRRGVSGDKCGFGRVDVARSFPFPELPGETFVPEALVWNRIARRYKTRFINAVVRGSEYRSDGLTANATARWVQSARSACDLYREQLDDPGSPAVRYRTAANFVRYGLHARVRARELLTSGRAAITLVALPVGSAVWLRDRWVLRRRS